MKLLYWNLHRNCLQNTIEDIISEKDLDIVIVSEYENTNINSIVTDFQGKWKCVSSDGGCEKIRLLYREDAGFAVELSSEMARCAVFIISSKSGEYALAGLHLHDHLFNPNPGKRMAAIRRIKEMIESDNKLKKIPQIFIGDFNADPCDPEMTDFDSMFAIMYKDVAKRKAVSKYDETEYRSYYNPMLNCFSEEDKSYGSYYYDGYNTKYWYCYDQIIVSHELIDEVKDVCYLKGTVGDSFVSRNGIPKKDISDHLPLYAELGI